MRPSEPAGTTRAPPTSPRAPGRCRRTAAPRRRRRERARRSSAGRVGSRRWTRRCSTRSAARRPPGTRPVERRGVALHLVGDLPWDRVHHDLERHHAVHPRRRSVGSVTPAARSSALRGASSAGGVSTPSRYAADRPEDGGLGVGERSLEPHRRRQAAHHQLGLVRRTVRGHDRLLACFRLACSRAPGVTRDGTPGRLSTTSGGAPTGSGAQ